MRFTSKKYNIYSLILYRTDNITDDDDEGFVWNTYHARPGVDGPRSSGIRRVHFNAEGFPVLDMKEEIDLKPELAAVKTVVTVPEK
jgi:hypothetical protein